ncbi:DUF1657 domain-containing protein [Bacillus testis]|uniref:DUF1657 domain-containing protein n=1 Tax=Bacillus testis TaxID=1622072 RepID=UPI00067EFE18|nr:DUF1657 domain-containing protein [Bacillus testis]
MTVASEVKQCLASMKGIESSLSTLALTMVDPQSKKALEDSRQLVGEAILELSERIGVLEREELQYKGF